MSDKYENKKRPIPEAFRVSLDISDKKANALLKKADEKQKEWAVGLNQPFNQSSSAGAKQRAKAHIEITSLEQVASVRPLLDIETEMLAEQYAMIGRYDVAADLSKDKEKIALYKKYWDAVWLDDDKWCDHTKHIYIKEHIFSIKESAEMPLLACNIAGCDTWNVLDAPQHLKDASAQRASVRQAVSGKSQGEVADFLNRNFRT